MSSSVQVSSSVSAVISGSVTPSGPQPTETSTPTGTGTSLTILRHASAVNHVQHNTVRLATEDCSQIQKLSSLLCVLTLTLILHHSMM